MKLTDTGVRNSKPKERPYKLADGQVRAEATFPAEGAPFSQILTIEDKERTAPIFQQLRQQLVATSVRIEDIRTALHVRARGRQ